MPSCAGANAILQKLNWSNPCVMKMPAPAPMGQCCWCVKVHTSQVLGAPDVASNPTLIVRRWAAVLAVVGRRVLVCLYFSRSIGTCLHACVTALSAVFRVRKATAKARRRRVQGRGKASASPRALPANLATNLAGSLVVSQCLLSHAAGRDD